MNDGLIPVGLQTFDAKGRTVWSYRMTPNDDEKPLPRTFKQELILHLDYSPHAYPWRNEITTKDGRVMPTTEWQRLCKEARSGG